MTAKRETNRTSDIILLFPTMVIEQYGARFYGPVN